MVVTPIYDSINGDFVEPWKLVALMVCKKVVALNHVVVVALNHDVVVNLELVVVRVVVPKVSDF